MARWVELGVHYDRKLKAPKGAESRNSGFQITETDREHWAFQPIVQPPLPDVKDAEAASGKDFTVTNPIDRFVLAKLQQNGLGFSPEASRELLIRRVTLDLIGLPPTLKEIDDFVNDSSADAYDQLIERLLASPHYGERWGRHWLDLARYAETDGFEHDAVRPNSWRFRDYVIQSFNADKPYDRFIREQLAGDEIWPEEAEPAIATGFNLLGPDMVDSSDQVQRRINTLNDMTDTTSLVFLGLTIGCARCHDHKFEPLSQKDYYSLQAHFSSALFDRSRCIASDEEREKYDSAMQAYNQHPLVRECTEMEEPVLKKLRQEKLASLSPEAITALETPPKKRTIEQVNLVLETEPTIAVSEKEMLEAMDDGSKEKRQSLMKEIQRLPKPPTLPMAVSLEAGPAAKTFVLNRGEYTQPLDEVEPLCPEILREHEDADDSPAERPIERRGRLTRIAAKKQSRTGRLDCQSRKSAYRSRNG